MGNRKFNQKTMIEPVALNVQTIINKRDLYLSESEVEKIIKENFAHQIAYKILREMPLKKIPLGDSIHENGQVPLRTFQGVIEQK